MESLNPTTAQSRYDALATEREAYLRRGRSASELTIPALLPPNGSVGQADLYKPFQSVGARGVNNLASKLLLALFPPGGSFFRLDVDSFVLEQLAAKAAQNGESVQDARAEFSMALSKVEGAVQSRLDQRGHRTTLFETLKHLIVSGNGMIQVVNGGGLRFHRLDSYVVKRDKAGSVVELVVKETLSYSTLPPHVREVVDQGEREDAAVPNQDRAVDLYTWVRREGSEWAVRQETRGMTIPGSEGTWPLDKTAFLPLRWQKVDGEDYGRGMVEEYIGDLSSLESLSRSVVEVAAAASKVLIFVDEAGVTSRKVVAEAPSGAVVEGNARDITIMQLEKYADFQVASGTADKIEGRLEVAFLLHTPRQAERVTAEEIRLMAQELEQSLGGVYSILAQELQRPLVIRVIHQMQRERALPALPDGVVSPSIITGMEGLGRNSDLAKLDTLIAGVAQAFGPEAVSQYINVGSYIKRRAAALGVDTDGVVRSEEEIAQQQQQAQMQRMAETLGPPAIQAMSRNQQTQDSNAP